MSNKIYYKDCHIEYIEKTPKRVDGKLIFIETTKVLTKQLVCDNPNVEKVLLLGFLVDYEEKICGMSFELLFKNGNRFFLSTKDVLPNDQKLKDNQTLESLFFQAAERYLENGGIGNTYNTIA